VSCGLLRIERGQRRLEQRGDAVDVEAGGEGRLQPAVTP
jgi:hypothetical protein